MKALLLSAGLGERLRPITNDIPKVMIKLNEKPCLLYAIENLKKQGVTDFLINTHHMPHKIKDFFGDGSKFGVKIKYSFEESPLGTSGSLNNFKEDIKSTFIVVYADVLADFDLKSALRIHKKNNAAATIILDDKRDKKGKGLVVTKEESVASFVEKPEQLIENALINSGFYVLEPNILNEIPKGFSDFGKNILSALIKKSQVCWIKHEGYIFDIGTINDLKKAEEFLKSQKNKN